MCQGNKEELMNRICLACCFGKISHTLGTFIFLLYACYKTSQPRAHHASNPKGHGLSFFKCNHRFLELSISDMLGLQDGKATAVWPLANIFKIPIIAVFWCVMTWNELGAINNCYAWFLIVRNLRRLSWGVDCRPLIISSLLRLFAPICLQVVWTPNFHMISSFHLSIKRPVHFWLTGWPSLCSLSNDRNKNRSS